MIKKIQFIFCLLALMSISNFVKSQATFGQVKITNCYQSVTGGTGIYNFMKGTGVGGANKVKIDFTNILDINHFSIYRINSPLTTTPTYTWLTDVSYTGAFDYTTTEDYIRITPILNPGALSPAIPMDIHFVDPTFGGEDWNKPCLPFSGFNFKFLTNLSGLCGVVLTLKLPPGTPPPSFPTYNNLNLSPGWNMQLNSNGYGTQTIPINSEYCDTTILPPSPNVNRCFTFDLQITIQSCITDDPNCPDLNYTIPMTFCCWCERTVW